MATAAEVIGEQAPGNYALKLHDHAAALPESAGPLKRVLTTAKVNSARTLYDTADTEAYDYQTEYKSRGKWFIILTAVAAIGGALVLYLPGASPASPATDPGGPAAAPSAPDAGKADQAGKQAAREEVETPLPIPTSVAIPLRWFLVVVSVVAGGAAIYFKTQMTSGELFAKWMSRRRAAERYRNDYFTAVSQEPDPSPAEAGELDLPSLAFEYFRRYQLDVQLNYFKYRGELHRKAARKLIGWEGMLAAAAAVVSGVLAYSDVLGDAATVFALLGVLIPTLISTRSNLSLLSQDQRHADRYKTNFEMLQQKRGEIDDIRRALARGSVAEAQQFVQEVNELLVKELEDWKSAFV